MFKKHSARVSDSVVNNNIVKPIEPYVYRKNIPILHKTSEFVKPSNNVNKFVNIEPIYEADDDDYSFVLDRQDIIQPNSNNIYNKIEPVYDIDKSIDVKKKKFTHIDTSNTLFIKREPYYYTDKPIIIPEKKENHIIFQKKKFSLKKPSLYYEDPNAIMMQYTTKDPPLDFNSLSDLLIINDDLNKEKVHIDEVIEKKDDVYLEIHKINKSYITNEIIIADALAIELKQKNDAITLQAIKELDNEVVKENLLQEYDIMINTDIQLQNHNSSIAYTDTVKQMELLLPPKPNEIFNIKADESENETEKSENETENETDESENETENETDESENESENESIFRSIFNSFSDKDDKDDINQELNIEYIYTNIEIYGDTSVESEEDNIINSIINFVKSDKNILDKKEINKLTKLEQTEYYNFIETYNDINQIMSHIKPSIKFFKNKKFNIRKYSNIKHFNQMIIHLNNIFKFMEDVDKIKGYMFFYLENDKNKTPIIVSIYDSIAIKANRFTIKLNLALYIIKKTAVKIIIMNIKKKEKGAKEIRHILEKCIDMGLDLNLKMDLINDFLLTYEK